MSFIINNIEKKLKKSLISKAYLVALKEEEKKEKQQIFLISHVCDQRISFVIKKLLFNFLIFFSRKLRNKKKNARKLVLFLKFYKYYNTHFFKSKLFFFKKYFLKENSNIFYFNKFFLSTKQVRLKPCLHRLKAKRILFYKKFIWSKNKKFRKKNILIFNKLFSKRYIVDRFNPFLVDSYLSLFNFDKHKYRRIFKKRFSKLLHKRFYYLFVHKRFIFSIPRKKYYTRKMISFNFRHRTYSKIFVNRRFFAHRRRRAWRRVYYARKNKRPWKRIHFFNFDVNSFNAAIPKRFIIRKTKRLAILSDYLSKYGAKLAKKRSYDKNFYKKFLQKKRFARRFKNILYFFKWKKKKFNFFFSALLKKDKNLRKIIFSAIWFNFFYKKIFWRKKKNAKLFLLFYYNNFFLNKTFLLFSSFFKPKFGFLKNKKRNEENFNFKSKRFTVYIRKIRRRIIQKKFKRIFVRFFIILLFFKLMKKHKRAQKFFLFRNSFFLNVLRKIRLNLLLSVLLGNNQLYFKNNSFLNYDFTFHKKNLKIFLLFNKKIK